MPEKLSSVCICPGKEVPFYCPKHGRVENPDWPALKAGPEPGITNIILDRMMNGDPNPSPTTFRGLVDPVEIFATGEWLSEMGDIVYPEDYGC